MLHLNTKGYELLLIPFEDFCLLIIYNKKDRKERIFTLRVEDYNAIANSKDPVKTLYQTFYSLIYGGKRTFHEAITLTKMTTLYTYEIPRNDQGLIEALRQKIPNFNEKLPIIEQVIIDRLV